MKVLLSAYACENNKGSEPETGLKWAIEIYKMGHELTILTRKNNKSNIEEFLKKEKIKSCKIKFIFFDLPRFVTKFKSKKILPIYFYYILWQLGIYFKSRKLHSKINFDIAHHLTFCSIRHFSFLWLLNLPFIIGPMSGGDTSPLRLRWENGFKGGFLDTFRDLVTNLIFLDPLFFISLYRAKEIAVTSNATLNLIPKIFRHKTKIFRSMGLSQIERKKANYKNMKKLLFVGRFVYWKGAKLALLSFYEALKKDNELTLTFIGEGPEQSKLKKISKKLGISKKITWINWLEQNILIDIYGDFGIFLFPSLHDSGGLVCLEAMACGLPVICLNTGGPGRLVDKSFGSSIDPFHNYNYILRELSKSILYYSSNKEKWLNASNNAIEKSKDHAWGNLVRKFDSYR